MLTSINKLILIIFINVIAISALSKDVTCTYTNSERLGFDSPLSASGANIDVAVENVLNLCLKTICTTVHKQVQGAVQDLINSSVEELEALLRFAGTPENEIQQSILKIQGSNQEAPKDLACTQPTINELLYMDTMCRTSAPFIECYR